jgi:hypothetical protein
LTPSSGKLKSWNKPIGGENRGNCELPSLPPICRKAGFQLSSSLIFTHERLVSIEFSDRAAMKVGRVTRKVRVGSDHRLNQGER